MCVCVLWGGTGGVYWYVHVCEFERVFDNEVFAGISLSK